MPFTHLKSCLRKSCLRMKISKILLSVILMSLGVTAMQAQTLFGKATLFNDGWLFSLSDAPEMSTVEYVDSGWRPLTLPHDWSIEHLAAPTLNSCTGYFPGGIGWYRKHFAIPENAAPKQFLYFEGVYNRSKVYVNGHLVGERPNGYVSFAYDITPYLNPAGEDNVIAVRVDHSREADSRWYTGSGIYRDVYLVGAEKARFDLWGVGWRCINLTPSQAEVVVDLEAVDENPGSGRLTAEVEVADSGGKVVARAHGRISADRKNELTLKWKNPRLWNIESPYLYTLRATLKRNGKVVDQTDTRLGLRTLHFDPDKGFALNGRNMKVKGVCLHHDAGVLGAVVPKAIWRTRLENLKKLGVNAIRMSHNPQAPVVYDLCDELGLLVMDEGSDEWEFPKRKWVKGWNVGEPSYEGSFDFFEEWIDRDVADMVRRDRNHPSVFMWSVGNEVDYPNDPYSHPVLDGANSAINQPMFGGYNPDAPDASRIGDIAHRIAGVIRSIDTSRPVTGALAGVVMSNQTTYPQAVDVVGYNYTENRYDEDHATYPDRVIYGSENGQGYDAWLAVRDKDFISGQFLWTGADYLGESGRWPSRGLGTGLLGFDNLPKGRGKFRASLWSNEPVAFLGAYPCPPAQWGDWMSIDAPDVWNFNEGDSVRVVCYTNAPYGRLLLNGKEYGPRKAFDDKKGMVHWDLPFAPGTLVVEASDESGRVVATDTIATSGLPYALRVTELDNRDGVLQLLVEVVDDKGVVVHLADNNISCFVGEAGGRSRHRRGRGQGHAGRDHGVKLLGLETSDNSDMSDHRDNRCRAHNGRIVAYFTMDRDEVDAGRPVEIRFTAPLLKPAVYKVD